MSLNPQYVTAPSLQSYFVDKPSGLPLAGGSVWFFSDNNRGNLKSVYELQGNQANYTYSPLPNPIILSSVGTIMDNTGNDVIPYYYPFDAKGNQELYFIEVYDANGAKQFTRSAWPNPQNGGSITAGSGLTNFIPNGQFLEHTNLPNNLLLEGSNILAQGGWTFELPLSTTSVNTAEFLIEQFTQSPPQSPRYLLQINCTEFDTGDTIKNLRIKWDDVNKFSTQGGITYTFAFSAFANVALPVNIYVYKFCGTTGTVVLPIPVESYTIPVMPQTTLVNFEVNFGLNTDLEIDLVDNNDFIAIDIAFPVNQGFQATFSDFVLTPFTEETVDSFPVQTNADMMTRGVMGWADTVDPAGMDLYLPPILTKYGMTWDSSQIGQVGMSVLPILSPLSTSPVPNDNLMPCDGTSYITSEYSSNGIPFQRLFNYLFNNTYTNGLPLYGTGTNYVSALIPFSGAADTTMRITYNLAGASSPLAANGGSPATNITFAPIYTYNGSTTGIATFGLFSSNIAPNTILLTTTAPNGTFTAPADSGTTATKTNFIFDLQSDNALLEINPFTGLLAFQRTAYFITTVSGASLVKSGIGRFFQFYNAGSSQQYYMWFNVDGANTQPPGSGLPIEVDVSATYSAQDVADVVREVLNAFQSTNLTMPAPLPGATNGIQPGSWLTFSSNPGGLRNFYVWFKVGISGTDPLQTGASIQVTLTNTDSQTIVRNKIIAAINSYQFQAPDFRGMFFRGADPNATWDLDAANRWSNTSEVYGAGAGTFEYSQLILHENPLPTHLGAGVGFGGIDAGISDFGGASSGGAGGSETRPVNTYIYPFIRY